MWTVRCTGSADPSRRSASCCARPGCWRAPGWRCGGRSRACGRDALDVVVTRRPSVRRKSVSAGLWSGPVEVLVDAELGFLLRLAKTAGGAEPEVTELVGADFDPVTDPAQFRPPPGSLIAEGFGDALGAGGPVWWAAKTAAGLAAGGLGAWIRYGPPRNR